MDITNLPELLRSYIVSDRTCRADFEEAISLNRNYMLFSLVDMADFDTKIFDAFVKCGRDFLKILQNVVDVLVEDTLANSNINVEKQFRINCKINELPSCSELCFSKAPRSRDGGKVIQFTGIVVGMTQATIIDFQRTYICNKCRFEFVVEVDVLDKSFSCKPHFCLSPEPCASRGFTERKSEELGVRKQRLRNFQELIVQELSGGNSHAGGGEASRSMPGSVTVLLLDDLTDVCKPGDWIAIIGTVENRWKSLGHITQSSEIEIVMIASTVHVLSSSVDQTLPCDMETEDDEFRFFWTLADRQIASRDQIIASICPRLFGLYPLKLAIALMLLGGSSSSNVTKNVTKRAEIHVLLVGDPGTGKSQLLGFARKLARRAVLTTGVGTSAAGLTVAAIQTSMGWSLEPGALLLADRGLCCIDEFSRMRAHDKTVVHEALEQQTVSVAKAGIVCRLPCRTAVLAATNARGAYDSNAPLTVNTSLSAPLISRFDLIFILRDFKNNTWDGDVADHILQYGALQLDDSDSIWSVSRLRAYLAYCSRFNPKLSSSATELITQYYVYRRNDQSDIDSEGRTTTRLLDSLARLTQAHAKLMCRGSEANLVDAVQAVILMETSRLSSSNSINCLFSLPDGSHAFLIFPEDPDTWLFNTGLEILSTLKMDHLSQLFHSECCGENDDSAGNSNTNGDGYFDDVADYADTVGDEGNLSVSETAQSNISQVGRNSTYQNKIGEFGQNDTCSPQENNMKQAEWNNVSLNLDDIDECFPSFFGSSQNGSGRKRCQILSPPEKTLTRSQNEVRGLFVEVKSKKAEQPLMSTSADDKSNNLNLNNSSAKLAKFAFLK